MFDHSFEVTVAVSQRVNRVGLFIPLFQGSFEWDEGFALYRYKDVVEKGSSMLKNDIEALPLNVRKDSSVAGYLFVCFISLIPRMRLFWLLKEAVLKRSILWKDC